MLSPVNLKDMESIHSIPFSLITVLFFSLFHKIPNFIDMYVVKRDGHREPVHFDKISNRISRLAFGLDLDYVDPVIITQKVRQL